MFTMFKYLYQVDGTYHDFIRVVVWSILLIDVVIIGLSVAKLCYTLGI